MGKRASINPDNAESGGDFGFPSGSTVTVQEMAWSTWGEAGERALKGGRSADDPALKIVGEIAGVDDPRTVFLGAGKASRLCPSEDGEYLEIAEGSSATALNNNSAAFIFLESLCDKKVHGKLAMDKAKLDEDPISANVGLKFLAGGKVVKRDFGSEDGQKSQNRPTLIADEIIELPGGGKKTAAGKTTAKAGKTTSKPTSAPDPEEDAATDDDAVSTAAETAVLKVIGNPKWRKGLPSNRVYTSAYAVVKGSDDESDIMKLVKSDDWMQDDARPWVYDTDAEMYREP